MPRSRTSSWLGAAVGVAAFVAALLGLDARATYGARTSADEPYYLLTAQSLAEDLDLDIADEMERAAYAPYHEIALNQQTRPLDDGQRLSPHDPLLSVLLAPGYAVGGWQGAKVTLALIAGITAALGWWVATRRFGVSGGVAALVVGGLACTAPLATYGSQVYPELPAGLAVLAGVAALTGRRLTRGAAAVACVAIVALPWLAVKYAPVAAVLAVALLVRAPQRLRVVTLAVLGLAGTTYLVVHQRIWGGWTVYATGDHFADTGEFSVVGTSPDHLGRSRRLVGLLADRSFGLVPWSPAWLLLPVAGGGLARRRPPGALLVGAVVIVGWLTATFVALTMHGWWFPGRQVVHVLPVAAVGIAWFVERHRTLVVPVAVAIAAGVVTWAWLAWEASTDRRTLIVDMISTRVPTYRVWGLLPDGLVGGTTADVRLAVAAVLVGVLAWLGWRSERGLPAREPGVVTEEGGDPACWLGSVCDDCGAFVEDEGAHECREPVTSGRERDD